MGTIAENGSQLYVFFNLYVGGIIFFLLFIYEKTVSDNGYSCFGDYAVVKNAGNFLHGGATATLVDLVGSAVIFSVGAPATGVSVEINVSYLDAAYADVSISPTLVLVNLLSLIILLVSNSLVSQLVDTCFQWRYQRFKFLLCYSTL